MNDFPGLIRVAMPQRHEEEEQIPAPPDLDLQRVILTDAYEKWITPHEFQLGDFVKPKEGFGLYKPEMRGVVIEKFNTPIINEQEDPEDSFARLNLDLRIAMLSYNSVLKAYAVNLALFDSRLLEPATEELKINS